MAYLNIRGNEVNQPLQGPTYQLLIFLMQVFIFFMCSTAQWWQNRNISLLGHSLNEQMLYFVSPNIIFNLSPKYSYNFDYPMGFIYGYVQIKYPLVRKNRSFYYMDRTCYIDKLFSDDITLHKLSQ